MKTSKIFKIYRNLLSVHGEPVRFWPQWCAEEKDKKLREVIALGVILTQRMSWRNVHLALENLKRKNLLSLKKVAALQNLDLLTELIRPAGFFQTKPKRIYGFCKFIVDKYGDLENFRKEKLSVARAKLLNLYGIGPETADAILLYALDKPTFVIDEYTKRLVKKEKLAGKFDYDYLKNLFEKGLPKNVTLYRNFHALIIIDQKGEEKSVMEKV